MCFHSRARQNRACPGCAYFLSYRTKLLSWGHGGILVGIVLLELNFSFWCLGAITGFGRVGFESQEMGMLLLIDIRELFTKNHNFIHDHANTQCTVPLLGFQPFSLLGHKCDKLLFGFTCLFVWVGILHCNFHQLPLHDLFRFLDIGDSYNNPNYIICILYPE